MGSPPILDGDLGAMSREQLIGEVKRLRAGIRRHRDASGHDLCWHHPKLWGVLPEKTDPLPHRANLAGVPGRVRQISQRLG